MELISCYISFKSAGVFAFVKDSKFCSGGAQDILADLTLCFQCSTDVRDRDVVLVLKLY